MKTDVKTLVEEIIVEATSDPRIDELVEQAIGASLRDIDFDTLKNNFEQAKKDYYSKLHAHLCTRLGVPITELGKYITSDMRETFATALQKAYEALKPVTGPVKEFDPQHLHES